MTIDLRYLIPFAMPFGLYFFVRMFFLVAGVTVSEEGNLVIAVSSLFAGIMFGPALMASLFDKRIEIGKVKLWEKKE